MVDECRPRIREITSEEAKSRMESGAGVVLVDVREDSEWAEGRILGAVHLGKGVLERDLEKTIPETGTEILFYCGGGYRSILAADAAGEMGYKNVFSIAGGYKKMASSGWTVVR